MARSKLKLRIHHDFAHLQPLTNVCTKYELLTLYSFRGIARTTFYRAGSNQGHTIVLHTYNPQPISLPSIDFLHPKVYEI